MDPLLDEDGRCIKSDLFPGECGCAAHRGGEVIDLDRRGRGALPKDYDDYRGLDVHHTRVAEDESGCTFDETHRIHSGDIIGLILQDNGVKVGWACINCVTEISETGTVQGE